jgi:hypothetical protein
MLPPSWLSRHGGPGDLHHFRGRQLNSTWLDRTVCVEDQRQACILCLLNIQMQKTGEEAGVSMLRYRSAYDLEF